MDRCGAGIARGLRLVNRLLRTGTAIDERFRPGKRGLGPPQRCLIPRQQGLVLVECRHKAAIIQLGDQVAGLDDIAVMRGDRQHRSGFLGGDRGVFIGNGCPRGSDIERQSHLHGSNGLDCRGLAIASPTLPVPATILRLLVCCRLIRRSLRIKLIEKGKLRSKMPSGSCRYGKTSHDPDLLHAGSSPSGP
ncbi:hypothetical protein D3C80_853650 [compost metagenome]